MKPRILPRLCFSTQLLVLAANAESHEAPIDRIAFGSCFNQAQSVPIFDSILAAKPEAFIWMGDNVYGDTEDMSVMRAKYRSAKELPAYVTLRETCRIVGTWDDHDYGVNDGGAEYPMKRESQKELLDFLDEPEDSPRREQAGVHAVADFGPPDKLVRVLLLDTRYHRDPIGSDGTILGEEQWNWLESQLVGSPAAVHVLVSSIQVLQTGHRFEKWANFPAERKRLLDLLAREDVPPVILLSGDRHLGEISLDEETCGYPLYEVTSSSLNRPGGGRDDEPNDLRVGGNFRGENFGTLTIDWSRDAPVVTAALRDLHGAPQRAVTFTLSR